MSSGTIEPASPRVADGVAIKMVDGSDQAIFEFLHGRHADMTEHRANELGEEFPDQIEP
jgi:3-deoxy-D-manno-octulosonate 8-phosphate phosphatase KdsC-like HAD superfamily phosphatase